MVVCPSCGTENPAAAKFCLECGTALVQAAGGAERKLVTVVFADVAGHRVLRSIRAEAESIGTHEILGDLLTAVPLP